MADQAELYAEYSKVLEQVAAAPYERDVHVRHIEVLTLLGLDDDVSSAIELYAAHLSILPETWLLWIQAKQAKQGSSGPVHDLTGPLELVQLYERAIQDFVSIPLLLAYSNYFIANHYRALGLAPPPPADADEDNAMAGARQVGEPDLVLGAAFGIDQVRAARNTALEIGGAHLSESSQLFAVWSAFELDLLSLSPTPEHQAEVDALFLARLAVPHLDHPATFSAYSSFITNYDNDSYPTKLPAANKLYAPAVKVIDDGREQEEAKLAKRGSADWAFAEYINWELEVKRPRVQAVTSLFQRATALHWQNEELWETWIEFAAQHAKASLLEVCERAVKAVPAGAGLWAAYLRAAEATQQPSGAVLGLIDRAIGTGLFEKNVDGLVTVYEAGAGFLRREAEQTSRPEDEREGAAIQPAIKLLKQAIAKINAIKKKGPGDAQLRLEKVLIAFLERYDRLGEASGVWEQLTKAHSTSYAVWFAHAEFEARHGDFVKAHEVYVKGCSAKFLDYPEYLLAMWEQFEKTHGTLADLEFAVVKIRRQRKGLERKRFREAQQQAQQQAEYAAQESVPVTSTAAVTATDVASVDDTPAQIKRERSTPPEEPVAKKVKVAEPAPAATEPALAAASALTQPPAPTPVAPTHQAPEHQTRDRENSTVFVVGPKGCGMTDDALRQLFSECGVIRQQKVQAFEGEGKEVGMVEFVETGSVLAAQTKDKKRFAGSDDELDVFLGVGSCLYVTNFPEEYDKETLEGLFKPFGLVFDTRWPSKRFKNTRRFCYVQFVDPAAAQVALSLHGTQLGDKTRLSVLLSDPGRKQARSDALANDKELFVGSLSKFVREADLRKLFEPFGKLKGVRLPINEDGTAKGHAFVEFDELDGALKALELNNHEFKKRRMTVTAAEKRQVGVVKASDGPRTGRGELFARQVLVRAIKPGTEEAIVQQAIERFAGSEAKVVQVIMDQGAAEAVVEFASGAAAGRVLLAHATTPLVIEGQAVKVTARGASAVSRAEQAAGPRAEGPMVPRTTRGRGKVGGLGGGGRGRGGRGGLGFGVGRGVPVGAVAGASAPMQASAPAAGRAAAGGGKGQDFFRALLEGK